MIKSTNQSIGQPIYPLIVILEDAKKGYLKAAEKVKDQVLSLLFLNFGYQKIRYINELKQLICRLGDGSEIDQFTMSLLHRTCMQLKNDSTAIEQIKQYDEVRSVLQLQVNGIKTVLNTIKEYTAKSYY